MLSVALTGAGPLLWEPTYGLQVYPSTYWQWGCLGRVSATDRIWNQTHNPSGVEKQWSHCCSLFTLSVHSTRVSSLILSMCSFSGSHWATTSIRWTNTLTSLFYISVTFCPREDHLCAANQNDPLRRARLRFTRDYVSQTGTLTQGCGIFRTDQCSRKGPCLTWLFLHALFIITPHFVTDSFFYPLVVIFHVAWFLKPLRARALCVSGLSLGDHLGPHTTDTRSEISPAGVNSFYSTRRSVHLTVRALGGTGSHCLVLVPSHCADAPPFSLSHTHTHVIVSHKCTLSGDDGLLLWDGGSLPSIVAKATVDAPVAG